MISKLLYNSICLSVSPYVTLWRKLNFSVGQRSSFFINNLFHLLALDLWVILLIPDSKLVSNTFKYSIVNVYHFFGHCLPKHPSDNQLFVWKSQLCMVMCCAYFGPSHPPYSNYLVSRTWNGR